MIISDLNHLETISEGTNVVGGFTRYRRRTRLHSLLNYHRSRITKLNAHAYIEDAEDSEEGKVEAYASINITSSSHSVAVHAQAIGTQALVSVSITLDKGEGYTRVNGFSYAST